MEVWAREQAERLNFLWNDDVERVRHDVDDWGQKIAKNLVVGQVW